MTNEHLCATLALLLSVITTGCGSGGSGGISKGELPKGTLPLMLTIQTQWPQDQDTHVPTGASILIQFDARLLREPLEDGLTYIEERATGIRVDTTHSLGSDGRSLVLKPTAPFATETWYTVHLSPMLSDQTERLLEEDLLFSFRTVDVTPPRLASSSLPQNATNVDLDVAIVIEFDETLDPASINDATVVLRSSGGQDRELSRRLVGNTLHLHPIRDLLPQQDYTLRVEGGSSGVRDLGGNRLDATIVREFSTRSDFAPRILKINPNGGGFSPNTQIFLHFDSSMDPATANPGTIDLFNGSTSVPFTVHADASQRTLRVVPIEPLESGRSYTVTIPGGQNGIANPTGTPLANSLQATFQVGTDATPPRLLRSAPTNGDNRVSFNAAPMFDFDELLDPTRLNNDTIELADDHGPLSFVIMTGANSARIILTPTQPFDTGKKYTVTIRGGPFGVRDMAGNALAVDLVTEFHTTTDRTPLQMTISPTHGHSAMPKEGTFTAAFDEPLDPESVNTDSVVVTDDGNRVVDGTVELSPGNRVITFRPKQSYVPGVWYTVTLRSGHDGIRESSGNWLSKSVKTSFRIAYTEDLTPPDVTVTLNHIANRRKGGLSVPSAGFELTIHADDPINYDVDLGSFEIEITGASNSLDGAEILRGGEITKEGISYVVPLSRKFATGEYTLRARARDMAGNEGVSEPLAFKVVSNEARVMPFERTQVVWVRFDLDRDHSGRADFVDDLYRLGLVSEGDPRGTNRHMIDIMLDGILSQTNRIFDRKTNGGRKATGSMPVLFTATEPRGITFAELAFGGLDPSAPAGRKYGAKSSGILGRAYFDQLNSSRSEKNTATTPGLGVFGGELFLFEAETHIALYPLFITTFARRFMKLVPEMGGTPAGSHLLDTIVLDPNFDVNNASPTEMRRYFDIFLAADDWAAAMAVILAHETGHTVGLVGSGPPPAGHHGDASLHNRYPNLGDVMSSAVGYESLVNLSYRFRDLNTAYLRQRVLLK